MPRVICKSCQRPIALCYCRSIQAINNRIKVTIIQHPNESKHPFNTARLAQLCLANSQILILERLSEDQIKILIKQPSAILYPSMPWLPQVQQLIIENDSDNQLTKRGDVEIADNIKQLVILDATWRKSKRMMFLHPALQQLPRICLTGNLLSDYKVRKSRLTNSLSSVESIYLALKLLEPTNNFSNMIDVFNEMINTQIKIQFSHSS